MKFGLSVWRSVNKESQDRIDKLLANASYKRKMWKWIRVLECWVQNGKTYTEEETNLLCSQFRRKWRRVYQWSMMDRWKEALVEKHRGALKVMNVLRSIDDLKQKRAIAIWFQTTKAERAHREKAQEGCIRVREKCLAKTWFRMWQIRFHDRQLEQAVLLHWARQMQKRHFLAWRNRSVGSRELIEKAAKKRDDRLLSKTIRWWHRMSCMKQQNKEAATRGHHPYYRGLKIQNGRLIPNKYGPQTRIITHTVKFGPDKLVL